MKCHWTADVTLPNHHVSSPWTERSFFVLLPQHSKCPTVFEHLLLLPSVPCTSQHIYSPTGWLSRSPRHLMSLFGELFSPSYLSSWNHPFPLLSDFLDPWARSLFSAVGLQRDPGWNWKGWQTLLKETRKGVENGNFSRILNMLAFKHIPRLSLSCCLSIPIQVWYSHFQIKIGLNYEEINK